MVLKDMRAILFNFAKNAVTTLCLSTRDMTLVEQKAMAGLDRSNRSFIQEKGNAGHKIRYPDSVQQNQRRILTSLHRQKVTAYSESGEMNFVQQKDTVCKASSENAFGKRTVTTDRERQSAVCSAENQCCCQRSRAFNIYIYIYSAGN